MGILRRRTSGKYREELTPWVGLTLGALYVAAVLGVAYASLRIQQHEVDRTRMVGALKWTQWLSRSLDNLQDQGPQELTREMRRAAEEPGIAYCTLIDPEGTVIAHTDRKREGKPPAHYEWAPTDEPGVYLASTRDRQGLQVISTRLTGAGDRSRGYELRVGLAPHAFGSKQASMYTMAGYFVLAVLCLYLLIYHFLRRALTPLAVIRDRLLDLEDPIEERIQSLRLNQSFDQISTSWNRLIGFVSELQEEMRRASLSTDLSAAMDGYRSERLTDILMQIPFGVLVIEPDQTISFANRSAVGMLSEDGEPLDGESASKVMDEPLRLALLSPEKASRPGPSLASRWTDHTFQRIHGEVVLRFWSIASEGGDQETIIFVQDVTQTKEAERARDQFLYHVTHELRTPLTNIRAYAETLSQDVIDDEQTIRECYNVIMGETQRLSRLVEDILSVSQLEVGTARLQAADLKLNRILRTVVQDQQGMADAKNIDLVLHLPSKSVTLRGDKDRLNVVFTNLVGNAIKYTPEGGRVDVRCSVENQRARIAITDTGIGIDPKDQERIFDKFYRVDHPDVNAVPGTGLGLSIVQETLRVHGGTVSVESRPGEGTTFTVTLPALSLDSGPEEPEEPETVASVEEM